MMPTSFSNSSRSSADKQCCCCLLSAAVTAAGMSKLRALPVSDLQVHKKQQQQQRRRRGWCQHRINSISVWDCRRASPLAWDSLKDRC
jgi:hypothetical protein